MKFMLIAKSAPSQAAHDPRLMAAVGQMAEEMTKAGVLVGMGGFLPATAGAELRLTGGDIAVDEQLSGEGPEVIGGFATVEVASKQEAIAIAKRFLQIHADILGPTYQMSSEVRQLFA